MRVALDLDGVCYHWDRTARYLMRRWYRRKGLVPPSGLERHSDHWNAIEQIVDREAWNYLWTTGVSEGLFRHGHIVGGTIEGLHEIVALGGQVVIATSRPAAAVADTLAWLTLHFHRVPLHGVHFVHDKRDVAADVYIDDAPHHIAALEKEGRACILFDQPWNMKQPCQRRAFGWVGPGRQAGAPPTVVDFVRTLASERIS